MLRMVGAIFAVMVTVNSAGNLLAEETAIATQARRAATLGEVRGAVEWKANPEVAEWTAGVKDTHLPAGSVIRTGRDSIVVIQINGDAENITAELDSESRLSIVELAISTSSGKKSTMLSLELGKATIKTKNISPGSILEIKTPTSIVSSQGRNSSFNVQVERLE